MKTCFILNPHSGRGRREARLSQTRRYFEKKMGYFNLIITQSRDDFTAQTRQALLNGFDQIVILGGDGSANAAINGFFENGKPVREDARLVISKWGTGSDYYRTVSAGSYISDWKSLVTEHRVREVDIGEIEFEDGGPKKYFLNLSSVGLSALVAQMKNRNPRWVPASLSYIVPAVGALLRYRSPKMNVTIDSVSRSAEVMAIFIAKGIYAGGGMKFGGGVDVDDGFFDVKLFEHMNVPKGLRRLPRLYQGRFSGIEEIHSYRAREIRVESEAAVPVECDGEVYGKTGVTIRLLPKRLRVCWPQE
ncbi:MAG: diacylglycerol kinase family protein [Bdellovibrionia bacterium]